MQVKSQDLFPTRLWLFEIPELLPHTAAWNAQIRDWRERSPVAAGRSNRRGWNSAKTVFADKAFEPLQQSAALAFRHAFAEMQLAYELKFRLEAWVNLHDKGGYNNLHAHPNVLLCACYYLQAPEGSGQIVFRDPRPGAVLTPFQGNGANCGGTMSVVPQAGQLIVFPNWLEHQVEMHEADEPRISISMNALLA